MNRLKKVIPPYLLVAPGALWLVLFFAIPLITMFSLSLQQGDVVNGYSLTWHWQTYADVLHDYHDQLVRSLIYGAISTVIMIVLAFPAAYWIAFYGGRRKSTYLFLLLLPFFVSFVLRTISWRMILTDDGPVLHAFKAIGVLPDNYHLLGTSTAVIGGLVYNYLPFMVLPIYVGLQRIDPRVVEASRDLYANPVNVFRKVVFPLSLPGVFAGVVMSFVPVSTDYVNSTVLGSSDTTMIGQVIAAKFLQTSDYPAASALSFILMVVMLVLLYAYARLMGTEDVMEVAAR